VFALPLPANKYTLKLTTVILFASLMLCQSLNRVWLVVSYQMNQRYIAEYLCVNKARPEIKCNGLCHLKAQLAQESPQDQLPGPLKDHFEVPLFLSVPDLSIIRVCADYQVLTLIFYPPSVGDPRSFAAAIFHPPC
jgi:hypothetical protein